ncbi:MFS general substrate transporter [Lentithecium fluviatile CBS 122367]|uniref:MFS general substrate transporter n=1 Tax=Lentithecium fluviatile CBS 122367 TaxID=1168545 RepID=A0A6G1JEQ2_9PLEO|nr:MFS general substrate transporter [Lentithecium fluviatile CBS 122367]
MAENNDAIKPPVEKSEELPTDADAQEHLTGWSLVSLALALMSSGFMLALDNTRLQNDIGWYAAAYLITQMSLLPTCGRIYTFYNVKYSYCVALLVFELGSVVCAVAPNSVTLIVGRAVTGIGATALTSSAAVLISYCVVLRKRAMLLGVYRVGAVTVPLVGGVITDSKRFTRRFYFCVNLSVGAIGVAQIWWTLKKTTPAAKAGLSPLCIIPLHIFRSRTDTTAQASGIYLLPLFISNTICTLGVGWIISIVGFYVLFMWIGPPILATGAGLYQLISVHSSARQWIPYQVVSGISYGMCTQIPLLSVQVVLGKVDVPTGCAIVLFYQCLGGALATSIAQNLFTDALLKKLYQIEGVDDTAVVRAGAKEIRRLIDPEILNEVIEASSAALRNVFFISFSSAIIALSVSSAMEW